MELALMDGDQKKRYTAAAHEALVAACEEQGAGVLPTSHDLANHFGMPLDWAVTTITLLLDQFGETWREHGIQRRR